MQALLSPFGIFLLVINLASFGAFALDYRIVVKNQDRDTGFLPGELMCLFAVAGGAVGMLAALFLFNRGHITKESIAWWFVAILCLILWGVIVLTVCGVLKLDIRLDRLIHGFKRDRIICLLAYLVIINIATFVMFVRDKRAAENRRNRTPEVWLLSASLLGGSAGGLIAMYVSHHKGNKKKKWYFVYGLPVFIVLHVVLFFYAHAAGLI